MNRYIVQLISRDGQYKEVVVIATHYTFAAEWVIHNHNIKLEYILGVKYERPAKKGEW